MDLTAERDEDHVIAVFRRRGLWGAIGTSKFTGLRYREAVYRTLRELAMSYFEHYFNLRGERTLRGHGRPVNLARFDRQHWMTSESDLWPIAEHLERIAHVPLLPAGRARTLHRLDGRLMTAGLLDHPTAGPRAAGGGRMRVGTAGGRRQSRGAESLGYYTALRARRAAERADGALVVGDASDGIRAQDLRVAELGDVIEVAAPIRHGHAGVGHVGMDRELIRAEVRSAIVRQAGLMGLGGVFCALAGAWGVRRIAAPLKRLTLYANTLAAADSFAAPEAPPADQVAAYCEKYGDFMTSPFGSPADFARRYPVPLRFTPSKVRGFCAQNGATRWQVFRHVALPIARPGIAVAFILAVIFSWNNFVFGIVLAAVFSAGMDRRIARHHVAPQTARIVHAARGKLFAGSVPTEIPVPERPAVEAAVREGYLAGFRAVMAGSALLCILAAVVAMVTIPPRRARTGIGWA